jgi:hypothetical protein
VAILLPGLLGCTSSGYPLNTSGFSFDKFWFIRMHKQNQTTSDKNDMLDKRKL